MIVGLTAEVEAGLDPSASQNSQSSHTRHEHAEVMVEILNQRAEYIGVPISDPIEINSLGQQARLMNKIRLLLLTLKWSDPIRELIRWAVVSKKIIIERGLESLSDRIKKQVIDS